MSRAAVTLLLAVLVLGPVGSMVVASLRADEVTLTDGTRLQGMILRRDPGGLMIRVRGASVSRDVPAAELAGTRRVWTVANYRRVLRGPGERNMLLATLALAGASTLLAFLVGFPLGLLLGATDVPGRRVLEQATILPLVLPPVLLAIATYRDLVLVEPSFLRAVLVFGLSLFPLVSLLTARAARATDASALEAARLQTTPFRALLRAVAGPALPGAAAGALLVFAFVVADFAVPDFLGVTTAKNTITVYANAVFRYWSNTADAGAATAAGMPPTVLALLAFAAVLAVEARRDAVSVGAGFRPLQPLPLGPRGKALACGAVLLVLGVALLWPLARHVETASGAHFGPPVAAAGANPQALAVDASRARPESLADGLRKGLQHEGVGESAWMSLTLAGGGALLALLLAIGLVEAGRGRPRLDKALLVASFLPVAVPPMTFAVGWVELFGTGFAQLRYAPVLLLGARLLPFATFAVRAARRRVADELLDAAAVAGLPPRRRLARITLPLIASGATYGGLLAFLFGLREIDALVFTRAGGQTLPVQLYGMIHYGYDVQVAGLSVFWTLGVALLLGVAALLGGRRFRVLP